MLPIPPREFVAWTQASFQTEQARDRFISDIATRQSADVEVEALPNESRGARVRWLPGQFLGLNDIAYSHGGRIAGHPARRHGGASGRS